MRSHELTRELPHHAVFRCERARVVFQAKESVKVGEEPPRAVAPTLDFEGSVSLSHRHARGAFRCSQRECDGALFDAGCGIVGAEARPRHRSPQAVTFRRDELGLDIRQGVAPSKHVASKPGKNS